MSEVVLGGEGSRGEGTSGASTVNISAVSPTENHFFSRRKDIGFFFFVVVTRSYTRAHRAAVWRARRRPSGALQRSTERPIPLHTNDELRISNPRPFLDGEAAAEGLEARLFSHFPSSSGLAGYPLGSIPLPRRVGSLAASGGWFGQGPEAVHAPGRVTEENYSSHANGKSDPTSNLRMRHAPPEHTPIPLAVRNTVTAQLSPTPVIPLR